MKVQSILIALCAAGAIAFPFAAAENTIELNDSTDGETFLTCVGEWSTVSASDNARKIELHSSTKDSDVFYCNEDIEKRTVGLAKGLLDKLLGKVNKILGELNKVKKDRDAAKKDYDGKKKKYEDVKGKGNKQEEGKCKKEMDDEKNKYDQKQKECDQKQKEYDDAKKEYDEAK